MFSKGYIQVYTGTGKGKTTAAIGLAIRALGAGQRVLLMQFMKGQHSSEQDILSRFSPQLSWVMIGQPYFIRKDEVPPGYREIIAQGVLQAKEALQSGAYDLVILDEMNTVLDYGLVSWDTLSNLLDRRQEGVEVVLTGRGAPRELLEKADLVTEMMAVKHYYVQGVEARQGIEF